MAPPDDSVRRMLAPRHKPHVFAPESVCAVRRACAGAIPPPGAPVRASRWLTGRQKLVRRLHAVVLDRAFVAAACVLALSRLALPRVLAAAPAAVLALAWAALGLVREAPYAACVVPGRVSAQLPSAPGGGLVVFNLGLQCNHPLGLLCPGGAAAAAHFVALSRDLMRRRHELGILAVNRWHGRDVGTSVLHTYYFRDVESIHRFAHQELHRKAWDWYGRSRFPHIGVFHETFVVPARSYETIYANCTPVGLGGASVKCDDVAGQEQ